MAKSTEFAYGYRELAALTGMALNTIHQHARRGTLNPDDLESVVTWLARHGSLELRQRLVKAAFLRELDEKPKPRSTRHGAPKKTKKRSRRRC